MKMIGRFFAVIALVILTGASAFGQIGVRPEGYKIPVRVATTANITLSGTQTIDGVALSVGDRVLVKDQSTGSQNGIWVVQSGAWQRATDFNSSAQAVQGVQVFVNAGTTSALRTYYLATSNPIVPGTTSLTFSYISSGAGSVTSVAMTVPSSIFGITGSPITSSGTLGLTVTGTSGGIPYFSSGSAMASSAALTANLPVVGGGAGAAPVSGTRTGNTTQFASATGSFTSQNCAKWDASSNIVDAGAACGTVTSVAVSGGINTSSGSSITSTGTLLSLHLVNAQTGTTYTYLDGDRAKLVTHTNASSIAGTLPQAGAASSFISGWYMDVQNRGAGTLTITPTTSTIDGSANLTLTTGQGVRIFSDGTNYFTQRGRGLTAAVTSVTCNGGLTGGAITSTGTCAADIATSSNFYGATSSKLLDASVIYTSEVTVTYGTTTTFDFNNFINGVVTLTGNITTMTFSNARAGKSGTIRFIQDATGSRTTVWNSALKWAGGSAPSLSTAANAVDVLSYFCISSTYCIANLAKAVS
mgnify:CR=1 FL=1